MFELPEYITLSKQMNESIRGKTIRQGRLGNKPHKFVWYNRSPEEFGRLTADKTVGEAHARGRWLLVPLEPGYVLVFGECGGKILFHPRDSTPPGIYHLLIEFTDGSSLSATTRMWGAMELYESGLEKERQFIKDMKITPVDNEFTLTYFHVLIDELQNEKKRSVKGLLTQEQLIPGLGNSSAQDIMFRAGLHPKHPLAELNTGQRKALFYAIRKTLQEITSKGGRYDEYDLYDRTGGYVRLMDKNALDRPCPECGSPITKIQYLGGACYFCPTCQS